MGGRRVPPFLLLCAAVPSAAFPGCIPNRSSVVLGDPSLPLCGFDVATDDSAPPATCAEGALVAGPLAVTRAPGRPDMTMIDFSTPVDGFACVEVENTGTASGDVKIDGLTVIRRDQFNPHETHLEGRVALSAGGHSLAAFIAGVPGSAYETRVRFRETDPSPRDPLTGSDGLLTLAGVFDAPDPFSPGVREDAVTITAVATVRQVAGGNGERAVVFAVDIVDGRTCTVVRTLAGAVAVPPEGTGRTTTEVPIAAAWDGKDSLGRVVKAGSYFYRVRAEYVRRSPGGEVDVLDAVTSRYRTITVRQASAVLLSDRGEPVTAIPVGESVVARIDDLAPRTHYDVRIVSNGDLRLTIADWRLTTDGSGSIPPVPYWLNTGVVGCGPGGVDDPLHAGDPFVFRSVEEAADTLTLGHFFLEVSRDGALLSCTEIPIVPSTGRRIFPADATGCLLQAPQAGLDDVYVAAVNLPLGAAVRLHLMEDRTVWPEGEVLDDLRGEPTTIELAPDESSFLVLLVPGAALAPGAFDVIAEVVTPMSPLPPFPGIVTVASGITTVPALLISFTSQFPLTGLTLGGRTFALTRDLAALATPFGTRHTDGFQPDLDAHLRLIPPSRCAPTDPTSCVDPPPNPGNVDVWVVAARDTVGWLVDPTLSGDVSGGPESITLGAGCTLAGGLMWPGPLPVGEYDVVVDVNQNGSYDPGCDVIDRMGPTGFFVVPDPGLPGPFAGTIGRTTYVEGFFSPPSVPDMNITVHGIVRYPADSTGIGVPWTSAPAFGQVPLVIVFHGQQADPFIDSAEGWGYLLDHLVSHGYVAFSANLDTWTSEMDRLGNPVGGLAARTEIVGEHIRYILQDLGVSGEDPLLAGHLDPEFALVAGHSKSGADLVSLGPITGVRGAVLVAPGMTSGSISYGPVLHLVGTQDCDVGLPTTFESINTSPPALLAGVVLYGLGHNLFNENWPAVNGCPAMGFPVPPAPFDDPFEYQIAAKSYVLAFAEFVLRGETGFEPYLIGLLDAPQSGVFTSHRFRVPPGTLNRLSLGTLPAFAWTSPGETIDLFFAAVDATAYDVLSFQALQVSGPLGPNPAGTTKLILVRLTDTLGSTATVSIEPYGAIPPWADLPLFKFEGGAGHFPVPRTIRIPLEDFLIDNPLLDLTGIEVVTLVSTNADNPLADPPVVASSGEINLLDIEFSK